MNLLNFSATSLPGLNCRIGKLCLSFQGYFCRGSTGSCPRRHALSRARIFETLAPAPGGRVRPGFCSPAVAAIATWPGPCISSRERLRRVRDPVAARTREKLKKTFRNNALTYFEVTSEGVSSGWAAAACPVPIAAAGRHNLSLRKKLPASMGATNCRRGRIMES